MTNPEAKLLVSLNFCGITDRGLGGTIHECVRAFGPIRISSDGSYHGTEIAPLHTVRAVCESPFCLTMELIRLDPFNPANHGTFMLADTARQLAIFAGEVAS